MRLAAGPTLGGCSSKERMLVPPTSNGATESFRLTRDRGARPRQIAPRPVAACQHHERNQRDLLLQNLDYRDAKEKPSWLQIVTQCANELCPADRETLLSGQHSRPFCSQVIVNSVDPLIARYQQKWVQRVSLRINPILSHIESFSNAINVYVQSNPAISGLVWGTLYLCITVGGLFIVPRILII
jgi:hypothetical protein